MDEEGQPPEPSQQLPQPPPQGLGYQPPPGLGPTPASRPASTRDGNANAGWLVVLGGVLILVGFFLPWITVTGPPGSVSQSGKDANEWVFVILGGFATVRGISMARPETFRFQLGTPLIGGVLLAVFAATRWGDLQNALDAAKHAGYTASIGIGFWAVIAGTVLVLLGGVMAMQRRRL